MRWFNYSDAMLRCTIICLSNACFGEVFVVFAINVLNKEYGLWNAQ